MFNVHISPKSGNAKTGPIPVTTTSSNSCPDTCPLNKKSGGAGCYAGLGHTGMHWRKVDDGDRGGDWAELVSFVRELPKGQIWRHNQAGDIPHHKGTIDTGMLSPLVKANNKAGAMGFTYTHHDMRIPSNVMAVETANRAGFTVNVSTNTVREAWTMRHTNPRLPLVTIVPTDFWDDGKNWADVDGMHVARCPAEYVEGLNCATCKACAKSERASVIAFTAHGVQKKKVSIIAKG
jgi:hypothetical protein